MGYEEEPLLKPQKTAEFTKEVPVAMPVQEQLPRTWDGGLLACCGSFDLPGWATFGLVHTCPCVAVGHNIKRALKGSLLLHAALYFLLFIFAYYMYVGALETEMAVCPNGLLDEASLYAIPKDEQQPVSDLGRRLLHKDHHPPHPQHPFKMIPWDELPAGCRSAIIGRYTTALFFLACALIGVVYCARNRTAIRERFGIAGTRFGDFCTWCCCAPCALCQETRTLWHNNVYEGVWHGPTQLPTTSPPPQQTVIGKPVA